MNITRISKTVMLLATLCALAVPAVKAIPLTFETSGIGSYAPASTYNNNTDATLAANLLVNWYNGGPNPSTAGTTFTLSAGTGVPASGLPSPVTFGLRDETSPFQGISSPQYSYILAKYGNVAYVFYIGNLASGEYTVPATLGGNGLSHELAFTAGRVNVPDGGATISLLGIGLIGLAAFRARKMRRA